MKLSASRPDVYAALTAVLAHAGGPLEGLDWVGLTDATFYATDRLTLGVSNYLDGTGPEMSDDVHLPLKEAKDLARYIKPVKVGHKTDTVQLLLSGEELHVGIYSKDHEFVDLTSSEVYAATDAGDKNFSLMWRELQRVRKLLDSASSFTVQAGLVARFKSAEREHGDRMRLYPSDGGKSALVTVGSSFVGAIAALSDPEVTPETPLGDSTLEDWGL